jgi:hypothetical protein
VKWRNKWSAIIVQWTWLKQNFKASMITLFQNTFLKQISQMLSLKSIITKMLETRKRKLRYLSRICCYWNNTFFSFRINCCWNNRNRNYLLVKNTMIHCYWTSPYKILWFRMLNHWWKNRKTIDNHFQLGNLVKMMMKLHLLYHNSFNSIKWNPKIGKYRFQNLYRFYQRFLNWLF